MDVKVPAKLDTATANFQGRTVLSFESRRSVEIAKLIENYGGQALVAPATREVPADGSADVSRFAAALLAGKLDLIIFLTGIGTRALARAIKSFCTREQFVDALRKVPVLARGPKPVSALKELGVPIAWNVPEPNTWREILQVLESNNVPLKNQHIAVQEYGIPSKDLVDGLTQRGAEILAVHVYDWALPEDLAPLKNAIAALLDNHVDVVLFTAAVQVHHLIQVSAEMNSRDPLIAALQRTMVASIGPVTSEALAEFGIPVQLEPTHPKMGFLVKEASEAMNISGNRRP
jgi:uroporphyrinogen-III synthase